MLIAMLLTSCASGVDEGEMRSLLSVQESAEATLESTRRAYELDPGDERALYNYAYMLTASGNVEEGLRIAEEGAAQNPESLRFAYLVAHAQYALGRHQSYLSTLDSILDWDVANTEVMDRLALYHHFHFHDDIAAYYALMALEYRPEDAVALSIMALSEPYYASLSPLPEEKVKEDRWRDRSPSIPPQDREAALSLFLSEGPSTL